MIDCDFAVSFHNTELVAHIISLAIEFVSDELVVHTQLCEHIGKIEFFALGSVCKTFFDEFKGFGRKNNSAENCVE